MMSKEVMYVVKREDVPDFMEQYGMEFIRYDMYYECAFVNILHPSRDYVLTTSAQPTESWLKSGYRLYNPKNQRILKRLGKL